MSDRLRWELKTGAALAWLSPHIGRLTNDRLERPSRQAHGRAWQAAVRRRRTVAARAGRAARRRSSRVARPLDLRRCDRHAGRSARQAEGLTPRSAAFRSRKLVV